MFRCLLLTALLSPLFGGALWADITGPTWHRDSGTVDMYFVRADATYTQREMYVRYEIDGSVSYYAVDNPLADTWIPLTAVQFWDYAVNDGRFRGNSFGDYRSRVADMHALTAGGSFEQSYAMLWPSYSVTGTPYVSTRFWDKFADVPELFPSAKVAEFKEYVTSLLKTETPRIICLGVAVYLVVSQLKIINRHLAEKDRERRYNERLDKRREWARRRRQNRLQELQKNRRN